MELKPCPFCGWDAEYGQGRLLVLSEEVAQNA